MPSYLYCNTSVNAFKQYGAPEFRLANHENTVSRKRVTVWIAFRSGKTEGPDGTNGLYYYKGKHQNRNRQMKKNREYKFLAFSVGSHPFSDVTRHTARRSILNGHTSNTAPQNELHRRYFEFPLDKSKNPVYKKIISNLEKCCFPPALTRKIICLPSALSLRPTRCCSRVPKQRLQRLWMSVFSKIPRNPKVLSKANSRRQIFNLQKFIHNL